LARSYWRRSHPEGERLTKVRFWPGRVIQSGNKQPISTGRHEYVPLEMGWLYLITECEEATESVSMEGGHWYGQISLVCREFGDINPAATVCDSDLQPSPRRFPTKLVRRVRSVAGSAP